MQYPRRLHQVMQEEPQTKGAESLTRYKLYWLQIYFFEPVYLENGCNGCRVYYDNGAVEEIQARLEWVLDDWASYFATSRALLQKQAAEWAGGTRRRLPMILQHDFCLIPVKCRKPRTESDNASGYVVLQKIRQVEGLPDESWSKIKFCSNHYAVEVRERRRSIDENHALGWMMVNDYTNGHFFKHAANVENS